MCLSRRLVIRMLASGLVVLLAGAAVLVALLGNRVSALLRVPPPALFLVAASVAAELWPRLSGLGPQTSGRIVTVALAIILFEGGMNLGWNRLRVSLAPVLWIGVAGTVVTAAGLAAALHLVFGLEWRSALLLGTALAPTDPAVVFSVLSGREVAGRSGTILEGESGANDPVGIALLIAVAGATGGGTGALLSGAGEFALEMAVGLAVGLAGGLAIRWVSRRVPLSGSQLYPIRTVAAATTVYGVAAVAHGSGFLAVFLAGILLGDEEVPFRTEIGRFTAALASLGEMVAFTVLGLSIPLLDLSGQDVLVGLGVAALLVLVVRPVLVGVLLVPIRLRLPERLFVLWAGLKGAVPILLGLFVLGTDVPDAPRLYRLIFVVVLVSVVVQGGSVPLVTRLLRIPMQAAEPLEPYAAGLRTRSVPRGMHRYTVQAGSAADGAAVADLGMGERTWLSLVRRDGELLHLRRDTRLHPGDQVLAQVDEGVDLGRLFRRPGDER
jgi:cell volume regulation protein A